MNLLSLISSWLDINCQITMKYATVPKLKLFHQLNTPWNSACEDVWCRSRLVQLVEKPVVKPCQTHSWFKRMRPRECIWCRIWILHATRMLEYVISILEKTPSPYLIIISFTFLFMMITTTNHQNSIIDKIC